MTKKVIYLFGSGATHAVINSLDSSKRLLTADIRQKIGEKTAKDVQLTAEIWNELLDPTVDIEHLISILESNYYYSASQQIKDLYHDAIINLSQRFITDVNEPKNTPNLYSVLFDLHNVKEVGEDIICAFTLNYENLLEQTLKSHLNVHTDYLIDKKTDHKRKNLLVLKLHGSFNWKNTRPLSYDNSKKIAGNRALWIPPGVEKKKENYPFNILWSKAFELLLKCNILRVIGCSLSRNDWGLIPMIYTAMRLTGNNPKFEIEIIDFDDRGRKIKDDYPYLNIKSISEIKEFNNYLRDIYSLPSPTPVPTYVIEDISSDASKKVNIFEQWLKCKRFELQMAGKNISTREKYFENFS